MSTNVTLHAGHDVAYLTSGRGRGGRAGAMGTTRRPGNRPGSGLGKGAAALGLAGQVDPKVIERLYQENTGPGGELLVRRRQSKKADQREQAAVAVYLAAHPYASAVENPEPWLTQHLGAPPGPDASRSCGKTTRSALDDYGYMSRVKPHAA